MASSVSQRTFVFRSYVFSDPFQRAEFSTGPRSAVIGQTPLTERRQPGIKLHAVTSVTHLKAGLGLVAEGNTSVKSSGCTSFSGWRERPQPQAVGRLLGADISEARGWQGPWLESRVTGGSSWMFTLTPRAATHQPVQCSPQVGLRDALDGRLRPGKTQPPPFVRLQTKPSLPLP